MRDWVEFNMNGDTVAVRPSYVVKVETIENGATEIHIDSGCNASTYIITEPYDEVMKKLKEAEEYELPPVVEHFTREEYGMLYEMVEHCLRGAQGAVASDLVKYRGIQNKLEKILKGEE